MPVALTYFWGLTLSVQGILTPSLAEAFPDPRLPRVLGDALPGGVGRALPHLRARLGPGWREYRVTVAVTLAWAVLVFAFNVALGVNYGYLNRKPASASLLDLLGPWPVYVLVALGILLAGWALMTWPWVPRRRRTGRCATG